MNERKELILNIIIKEHIITGEPVGSTVIVDKYKLDISPATVRNEMSELENEGFIMQPHTSAGRIPTEKAYYRYLEKLSEKKLNETEMKNLDTAISSGDETGLKNAAKVLARLSGNAVFWAFHRRNIYYTGVSNLLKQPEFREIDLIYDISSIIDRMDEIIDKVFDKIDFAPQILIGSKNPFSDLCSSIVAKYRDNGHTGLFGIMGPLRMDYAKNKALINYLHEKLSRSAAGN